MEAGYYIAGMTILLVIVFFIGRAYQIDKDRPEYIPEGTEHDGSKPHYHEHDRKNWKK